MKWIAFFNIYKIKNYFDLMAFFLSALMKYLNGNCYVEVQDKRYKLLPSENILLGEPKEPKSRGTQHQEINDPKNRNQKVIKDENDELQVKPY